MGVAKFYKNGSLIGTGVCAVGSNSITSFVLYAAGGNTPVRRCGHRRTLHVECTGGAVNGVFKTRVEVDGTILATPTQVMTLRSASPFG